jgi:hypothetical protein
LLVLKGQVRLDEEEELLDRAGERERRLVRVAPVNAPNFVAADIYPE